MNSIARLLVPIGLGISLALTAAGDAVAARMGGGKSFGSRPSFSTPYNRSSGFNSQPGSVRPSAPAQQPALSPAQQRNQALRDGFRQRGGLGSLIGGLALGGLLGALFFGGGFEHFNFLDLLVFGGVAFLLYRLLAARRTAQAAVYRPAGYGSLDGDDGPAAAAERRSTEAPGSFAGFDTDILTRKGAVLGGGRPVFPPDFDARGFLQGARAAYEMMQRAWDENDLSALRGLTTDAVFGELQEQLRARGNAPNHTELLRVEAEILEVRDVGPEREVAVLFDVLMREEPAAEPQQVREVWHFTRTRSSRQPTWFLDGIQQVED